MSDSKPAGPNTGGPNTGGPNTGGPVIGRGPDIIECVRIAKMIEKHGELFLNRVYTRNEIAYCSCRKSANQHYAGRWAAKEAVLKALGTGWARGIQWTDIEIGNEIGGRPYIELDGQAKLISQQQGIQNIMISISHCRSYAIAYATAVGAGQSRQPES